MFSCGRIVRLAHTRSIRCYECGGEGCLVIYSLVASFKAKKKANVGDVWFQVSPISLFLRARVLVYSSYGFF